MTHATEMVIANIDGTTRDERLVLVLCQRSPEASHLELRQESWSSGIGWFTQNRVRISPEQVAELRSAFGNTGIKAAARVPGSNRAVGGFVPRLVHADSA